jgi:hypothetical protein
MKAKKKKLTNQPSIKKRLSCKIVKEFFYEMYHLKQIPMPKEFFERINPQLIEWAKKDPRADKLSKFFSSLGVHMQQVDRWCKKNESFKAAVSQAKQLIGDRRHDMITRDRDINPGLLMYTQAVYDRDANEMMHTRAQLKQKLEQPPTTVVVQMPDLTREDKE